MPKLNPEEIQKIESFLAKKITKPCSFCGVGPIDAKQDFFMTIPIGVGSKAVNIVGAQCLNCHQIVFFNYDSIIQE